MTFYDREATSGVLPVELVTFALGSGPGARVWRMTTGDRDVTLDGLTYKASTLTVSPVRREQTSGKTAITLTMAAATPFVSEWRARDPLTQRGQTSVILRRVHLTPEGTVDATGGQDRAAVFDGVLAGMELDGGTATLQCDGLGALFATPVPRVPIGRTCAWAVYSLKCGLNPADVARTGTIASLGVASAPANLLAGVPTVTITMDGSAPLLFATDLDEKFFDGGVLVWTGGTAPVRLHLASADLSAWPTVTAVLYEALPSDAIGDAVTLWPGCQKTVSICRDRFNNVNRFGGFPRLPERNPLRQGLL